MKKVTAENWAARVRESDRQMELYDEIDNEQLNPLEEPNNELVEPSIDEEIAEEEEAAVIKNDLLKCDFCSFQSELPHVFKCHTNSIRKCDICLMVFCGERSKRNLESHLKKEHTYKPKSAHICFHCKKPFQYASKLKNHMIRSVCGRQVAP